MLIDARKTFVNSSPKLVFLEKVELRDEDLRKFSHSELVHIRSKVKSVYVHLKALSKGRQRIDQPKKSIGFGRSLPTEGKKDEDKNGHRGFERLDRVNRQVASEVDCRLASLNPTVDRMQGAIGCRANLSYTDEDELILMLSLPTPVGTGQVVLNRKPETNSACLGRPKVGGVATLYFEWRRWPTNQQTTFQHVCVPFHSHILRSRCAWDFDFHTSLHVEITVRIWWYSSPLVERATPPPPYTLAPCLFLFLSLACSLSRWGRGTYVLKRKVLGGCIWLFCRLCRPTPQPAYTTKKKHSHGSALFRCIDLSRQVCRHFT